MDDYSALAQRIAVSVSGVRGSLILSRDGLVLGAHPQGEESLAKPAWLKFVTLGEPEKSFVEFSDVVWAFVKRGPYAAFTVADAGTRPGILVDQMEQVLLSAEEGRSRRDTVRLHDASAAPTGKPRTSLHPPAEKPQPSEVVAAPAAEPAPAPSADPGALPAATRDAGTGGRLRPAEGAEEAGVEVGIRPGGGRVRSGSSPSGERVLGVASGRQGR